MTSSERKVAENRLRRMADRMGAMVVKHRVRDKYSLLYQKYQILVPGPDKVTISEDVTVTNPVILGGKHQLFALDEIEDALIRYSRGEVFPEAPPPNIVAKEEFERKRLFRELKRQLKGGREPAS